jgi:hypothetical protein
MEKQIIIKNIKSNFFLYADLMLLGIPSCILALVKSFRLSRKLKKEDEYWEAYWTKYDAENGKKMKEKRNSNG